MRKTTSLILLLVLLCSFSSVHSQSDDAPPGFDSWEAILEAAEGTTVYWHLWGGADSINEYVDTFYGTRAMEEYGIELVRVPLNDTADAVAALEAAADGEALDPPMDLVWINGENFFRARQQDLLFGNWAETIPNAAYVAWDNPAIANDFGFSVDGYESPWSSAQFQFIYDSAMMDEEDLPRSYAELTTWIQEHPGRFTYVAPGAFQGTRFVKQLLYEISGGVDQWQGEFNEELYNTWTPQLWDLLNSWEPYLWDAGAAYPADENELHNLFNNGEIDFSLTQATSGALREIENGNIPDTSRAFVFDQYMIGDYNYLAIPELSENKAGAMVIANMILEPELQAAQVVPINGFGLGYAIDIDRVPEEDAALMQLALDTFGDAAVPIEDLLASVAPEMRPEYQDRLEADWAENVLNK